MTERRAGEAEVAREAGGERAGPPSRRIARSPTLSALVLAVCAWLLWDLWPDVAYFASSREPIDLGGPGAYHLDRARENRLAQIRGQLVEALPVLEGRSGAQHTVGLVAGTPLVVDLPGRGGPAVFEGRLLPVRARRAYDEAVAVMRRRGASVPEAAPVLREGDRPGTRWIPVAGSAALLLLALLNLRAIVKHLTA